MRADDDEAVLRACAMVVAAIDSGCWLVSAEPPVTARLRVAWEAVVLSVWGALTRAAVPPLDEEFGPRL